MMEQKYIAGIYCRLSKDDDRPGESMSIETQRAMLTEYCVKNNLEIYDVYVDDGFTGTNFEREAFQRLLNDIDAGTVNMVLTKDVNSGERRPLARTFQATVSEKSGHPHGAEGHLTELRSKSTACTEF